jgi:uncharacterized membrane protein YozB (DUF420 family)
MYKNAIRQHITIVAIVLFLAIFGIVQWIKPGFLYNRDGSVREFGVGYKNKTILPLWLFSILLGILSYLFLLYLITYPRLFF